MFQFQLPISITSSKVATNLVPIYKTKYLNMYTKRSELFEMEYRVEWNMLWKP